MLSRDTSMHSMLLCNGPSSEAHALKAGCAQTGEVQSAIRGQQPPVQGVDVWQRSNTMFVSPAMQAVYTQQKFNLLREEGEGYAKLLAALNRFGGAAISPTSVAGLVRKWFSDPGPV